MELLKIQNAHIPALGFGVFRMVDNEIERLVPAALEAGFRHFDTAQIYNNEAALGRALQASGAKREDLFLTTKIWVDNYSEAKFLSSLDDSLEKLQVEQVDLLLLHWPGQSVPIAEQIALLDTAKASGKTRHLGVSNQNIAQLQESIRQSAYPILTNQIEVHPYLEQSKMLAAAEQAGVFITAYFGMADGKVPNEPLLQQIGKKYGKSAAQVGLRWLLQQGLCVLSKTANLQRVQENAAVFDFVLSAEEMQQIHLLARQDGRLVSPPELSPKWD